MGQIPFSLPIPKLVEEITKKSLMLYQAGNSEIKRFHVLTAWKRGLCVAQHSKFEHTV